MKCPFCGKWDIREGETFCQWCGRDLREAAPAPEPIKEPEPVPKPEPAPGPEPIPEPTPVPEPEPEPKPEPVPEPEPEPKPAPAPAPRTPGTSPYLVAILSAVIAALVFGLVLALLKPGQTVIVISLSDIEDDALRTYVSKIADTDGDGSISQEEADAVTEIDLGGTSDSGRVASVSGIGYFRNLKSLNCSNNALTSLDLSSNSALEQVFCDNNSIEHIELPAGGTLTTIHAENNPLTSIDLSQQTGLTDVRLDEDVEIVGSEAPSDEAVREKVEDMALVYSTATFSGVGGANRSRGEELVVPAGTDGSVDAQLIANLVYPVYTPNASRVVSNEYGVDLEHTSDSSCTLTSEAINEILRSFTGSAPESLDYLVTDRLTKTDSDSWVLLKESPRFNSFIFTGSWSSYGKLVSFDAAIGQTDMMSDTLWFKFRVTAVEDPDSIFGFHLVSMMLTEDMPALRPEVLFDSMMPDENEQVANMSLPICALDNDLYFYSSQSSSIASMDLETGQVAYLIPIPHTCNVWSLTVANGRIYYIQMEYGTTAQYEELISVRLDGTDERVLLSNQAQAGTNRAVFSGVAVIGETLYLQATTYGTATSEGSCQLFAMGLRGEDARTVCSIPGVGSGFVLSADSDVIYYASEAETYRADERSVLYAYDTSDGTTRAIYQSEIGCIDGLRLQGDRLAFREYNSSSDADSLASVKTNGTGYVRLFDAPEGASLQSPVACSGCLYAILFHDSNVPLPETAISFLKTPVDRADVSLVDLGLRVSNPSLGISGNNIALVDNGFDVSSLVTKIATISPDGQVLLETIPGLEEPAATGETGSTAAEPPSGSEGEGGEGEESMVDKVLGWADSVR